jgi:predicted small lipoprotein YifL
MGDGGMRGVVVMGLFASLLALAGCGLKSEGTSYPENLPPKPPNCPELSELKNITLKDGSIVDVRIIRDGDETFYIPFSWFAWEASQTDPEEYWNQLKSSNPYRPGIGYDIGPIACPGVVHEREFLYKTPYVKIMRFDIANKEPRDIPPNFSADGEIKEVTFRRIYPERPGYKIKIQENRIDEDIETFGLGHEAFIRVGKSHIASYRVYDVGDSEYGAGPEWDAFRARALSTESWRLKRDDVRELFNWLKTPPAKRDNDRIFKLGAEQK